MIPTPISAPPFGGALNATHTEILRRRSAACGREIGEGMIPTPAGGSAATEKKQLSGTARVDWQWVPTGRARGTHFVVPRLGFASLGTTPSKGPRPEAVARVEGSILSMVVNHAPPMAGLQQVWGW